jgi:hypothetical protein
MMKVVAFLKEHFGLTLGGVVVLIFTAGWRARTWQYERLQVELERDRAKDALTSKEPDPGGGPDWDLGRLLVTADEARALPRGTGSYEFFREQRVYVRNPEPRWTEREVTEGDLRRMTLSNEALAALGWELDQSFERTKARVWTSEPVLPVLLQPAKAALKPVVIRLQPQAGVQRIDRHTLRGLWQGSWDAAEGGLPTHVATSTLVQQLIEGLWISSRFRDLRFRVDTIRTLGDTVYLASEYEIAEARVEGTPGTHLVRLFQRSVFVDRGGEGVWIWTSTPSVDGTAHGDGWLADWLLNVRAEVQR